MKRMDKSSKVILLDADVISHFIVGNGLLYLSKILSPHRLFILDIVYNEVSRLPSRKKVLDKVVLLQKEIEIIDFPDTYEIKKEFASIKRDFKLIGDGERACMAVAKYNKNIIASSNFRDIPNYCIDNDIKYIGTLDILTIAVRKGVFSEEYCLTFLDSIKTRNRARLPFGVVAITDYKAPDLSFI